jgi:hypothetical protein
MLNYKKKILSAHCTLEIHFLKATALRSPQRLGGRVHASATLTSHKPHAPPGWLRHAGKHKILEEPSAFAQQFLEDSQHQLQSTKMSSEALVNIDIKDKLPKVASGKVRDLYAIDDDTLLFVASDRISAYDVIMDNVSRTNSCFLSQRPKPQEPRPKLP